MRVRNLFLPILSLIILIYGCREHNVVDPVEKVDYKPYVILLNPTGFEPWGIETLYINEGDTVQLNLETMLLNSPDYSWESADESILKIIPDPDHDSLAYAVAVADSGSETTLTITDAGNYTEKTVQVKISRYWANPVMYDFMGRFGNSYYYISRYKMHWIVADIECKKSSGHLVCITSEEENLFIAQSPVRNLREIWIGLTYVNNDPLTYWVSGELLEYKYYQGAYTGTGPGDGGAFYFFMNQEGKWLQQGGKAYYWVLEMED